jgi:hypothetical protein
LCCFQERAVPGWVCSFLYQEDLGVGVGISRLLLTIFIVPVLPELEKEEEPYFSMLTMLE